MDTFDVFLIVLALVAAIGGYRIGFIGRIVSWLGLALGFYLAVHFLPSIIVDMASASPGAQLGVAILVLIGGAMVGQAIGLVLGARLHRALPFGPIRLGDRVIGAGAGILGVIVALWLLLPSISAVPGWPARATTNSSVSRWVSSHLPNPPNALQVLRRVAGQDAPQVFAVLHPGIPTGSPPAANPLGSILTTAISASTVKVEGQACGRIFEGSGFAVGTDLIATNAHVVAGEPPGLTSVLLPSGKVLPATVVMFDPRRDLAFLRVASLDERPLPLQVAQVGATGAAFGHPHGQDALAVTPARVAQETQAVGRDIYDRATTKRDILVLAAALAHGDSGGPLVNRSGAVIGVVFAISADQAGTSYALSTTVLNGALAEPRITSGASTGPCLAG